MSVQIIYERAFAELEKDLVSQRAEVEKHNQVCYRLCAWTRVFVLQGVSVCGPSPPDTHTHARTPNAQLMETDFKLKEQAEAAIVNTKKNFVKKQNALHEQMKQLEEKVTYRPLAFIAITDYVHHSVCVNKNSMCAQSCQATINVEKAIDDQIAVAIGPRGKK